MVVSICDRLYLSRQLRNELFDNELSKGYNESSLLRLVLTDSASHPEVWTASTKGW
ncbi:MAG: hypothetical protein V7L09_30435 [Nostoc sp.]|uniref:hypothetical protein n=1 Tax=Nostoc sp. TaxID=1180 RepID=UPI002FF026E4